MLAEILIGLSINLLVALIMIGMDSVWFPILYGAGVLLPIPAMIWYHGRLIKTYTLPAIYGVFAFIIGEDETSRRIEDGSFFSDAPYGTIHRIAGNGTKKGSLPRQFPTAKAKSLICASIPIRIISSCSILL